MKDIAELNFDPAIQEIFENTFSFWGTLTSDGIVLDLNGNIFQKTATAPELLIGQKFSETVYWQSTDQTPIILEQAICKSANGEKTKNILDFRVNSQEKIYIEFHLQPIKNSSNVNQLFFCALDITERERNIVEYKNRNHQLNFAAENADTGLWFWNLSKETIFATQKCRDLLGLKTNDDLTIKKLFENIQSADRTKVQSAFEEARINGQSLDIEYNLTSPDGKSRRIAVRAKTHFDERGIPENIAGIVRGISDSELANEELSIVYDREKKARDEAEEANRAKDFFLAVVSHELRSPLNAILGWSKILLTKEVDPETTKSALETIEKSARSQARLIEDLLDSARVASGKLKMEFRPINLYEIIKTVCNLQKSIAETKKTNLSFISENQDVTVFGDASRLQQVFNNLLSNALKFTVENENIEVKIETTEDVVEVIIKDDGQGINADTLPTIFNQFRQGEAGTSRDSSGLGLGLSIVKILVEKHQGTVRVKSDGVGKGSTFTVTLPLCGSDKDAAAEIKNSTPIEGRLLDGIKILVVEDDPDSREVLQLLLEQSGAEVRSAESAAEATNLLEKYQSELPDVIVSDLAMPVEDGYSLIARIRKLEVEEGGKIPALALSAFASNENKEKAYQSGFQKYHTKPFDPDGIVRDILNLLKESNSANKAERKS